MDYSEIRPIYDEHKWRQSMEYINAICSHCILNVYCVPAFTAY